MCIRERCWNNGNQIPICHCIEGASRIEEAHWERLTSLSRILALGIRFFPPVSLAAYKEVHKDREKLCRTLYCTRICSMSFSRSFNTFFPWQSILIFRSYHETKTFSVQHKRCVKMIPGPCSYSRHNDTDHPVSVLLIFPLGLQTWHILHFQFFSDSSQMGSRSCFSGWHCANIPWKLLASCAFFSLLWENLRISTIQCSIVSEICPVNAAVMQRFYPPFPTWGLRENKLAHVIHFRSGNRTSGNTWALPCYCGSLSSCVIGHATQCNARKERAKVNDETMLHATGCKLRCACLLFTFTLLQ